MDYTKILYEKEDAIARIDLPPVVAPLLASLP